MSHLGLMLVYATFVSVFFAALWRRTFRQQAKLFLQMLGGMIGGGLALAWLMTLFPSGPPAGP